MEGWRVEERSVGGWALRKSKGEREWQRRKCRGMVAQSGFWGLKQRMTNFKVRLVQTEGNGAGMESRRHMKCIMQGYEEEIRVQKEKGLRGGRPQIYRGGWVFEFCFASTYK